MSDVKSQVLKAHIRAMEMTLKADHEDIVDEIFDNYGFGSGENGEIRLSLPYRAEDKSVTLEDTETGLNETITVITQPTGEPLEMLLVLDERYTARAAFTNQDTGELEYQRLTPEQQEIVDRYMTAAGRNLIYVAMQRSKRYGQADWTNSRNTNFEIELSIIGGIINCRNMTAGLRKRGYGDAEPELAALEKCLETAHEIMKNIFLRDEPQEE